MLKLKCTCEVCTNNKDNIHNSSFIACSWKLCSLAYRYILLFINVLYTRCRYIKSIHLFVVIFYPNIKVISPERQIALKSKKATCTTHMLRALCGLFHQVGHCTEQPFTVIKGHTWMDWLREVVVVATETATRSSKL